MSSFKNTGIRLAGLFLVAAGTLSVGYSAYEVFTQQPDRKPNEHLVIGLVGVAAGLGMRRLAPNQQ